MEPIQKGSPADIDDRLGYSLYPDNPINLSASEASSIRSFVQDINDRISQHLMEIHRLRYRRNNHIMGVFSKSKANTGSNAALGILTALDPGKISAAILACISSGHVIQFSFTKKGNALIIGVYDGKDNDKVYPETFEDADEALDTILEAYGASYLSSPPQASEPTTKPRSRSKSV